VWNVLAIPYILAVLTSGVIYCSTRMLFMLRDANYFNIENSKIGTVNSDLIFNAMLGSIPISLAAGYCYDIFGRKILIIGNALLMCVLCYLTPLTAPSLQLLQYNYIFVRSTMVFVSCNPLVVDYVERDSLGRASALSNIGGIVGDIFSMGFLITVTDGMTHEYAFFVIALILAALTVPLLWMLKEPEVTLAKEAALKKDDPEQLTDAEE
jgi:MFS family permease